MMHNVRLHLYFIHKTDEYVDVENYFQKSSYDTIYFFHEQCIDVDFFFRSVVLQ